MDDDEEAERATGEWLERLARLKVEHESGAVSDERFATEAETARSGLRAGTAVPVTGEDADYVAGFAYAILGDPVPGSPEDAENARRGAMMIERIVRLKLRHESGELDDQQFLAAQAALGAEAQLEAEQLDAVRIDSAAE